LIQVYLKEEEYRFAHYHQAALRRINKNIHTLRIFENPLLDKTEWHRKSLTIWEDMLGTVGLPDEQKLRILQQIEQEKDAFRKLEEASVQSKTIPPENTMDQALSDLFSHRIPYFKLHLTQKNTFYFKFRYAKRTLFITMPFIKNLTRRFHLNKKKIKALTILGFALSKGGNKLSKTLKGDTDEISKQAKVLLSRIVFDIFYVQEFDDQSAIEFGPSKAG